MPRLSLQHYEIPDYASHIPNIPRSERPLQKIADLLYALHGIQWFKKKNEKEPSNTNDSQTEVSPNSDYDRSHQEYKGGEVYDPGFDPASATAEEAFNAGREAAEHNSDDYKKSMEEAFENARKARGLVEKDDPRAQTRAKAQEFKDTFGTVGNDDLDKAFPDVFKESKTSKDAREQFAEEQEDDLKRYVRNLLATEDANGYEPADYTPEEYANLFESEEGGSSVANAKKAMEGYRPSGNSREPDGLWGRSLKSSELWED